MKLKNIDTNECHVQFGKFIREARERRGLYQSELAEKVGIVQSYLSRLERGERDIDLALALKLCDALSLDIQDFIKTYM